ncbi:hypothetical protein CLV28_1937 [Sediminihabitans luteus]|uniref:Uncharacterized protein n=1 Tax=Sediminihabitans luteus TaxID=1138585 RepID=A0A2M9CR74_9CELL|nr:hypothetical protein [Sediminihabitans luteus]PJJ74440.1 hypothetical protein CLV28_1937 [Sediminihabitans luteus]GIJ00193.1 hypothetical protein Slu03_25700 [Sediminihabitans luteus]
MSADPSGAVPAGPVPTPASLAARRAPEGADGVDVETLCAGIDGVRDLPADEQVAVFEAVHARLESALTDADG